MQCVASGHCACFGGKHRASSVKRRPYSAAFDNVVLTQREVMNDSDGLGDATAEGTTFRPGSCMSTAWSSSREAYGWGTWWNGWCMREKKRPCSLMPTLVLLAQRPKLAHLWITVTGLLTAGLLPAAAGAAGAGGPDSPPLP